MKYTLWVDDIRNPKRYSGDTLDIQPVIWARDVEQAIYSVEQLGFPDYMVLDYHLADTTVMTFIDLLFKKYPNPLIPIDYEIISDHPGGIRDINNALDGWKRINQKQKRGT